MNFKKIYIMIPNYFKLLFLKPFVLSFLLLASCEKPENDVISNSNKLLGKWNWINQISWYKPSGSNITIKDTTYFPTGTGFLEFKPNATYFWKDSYGVDSGKYSISGNKLIFQNNNAKDSFDIKELTDNSLSLYVNLILDSEELWNNFKR